MALSDMSNISFLDGGGEMGQLTRSYDWGTSPIGTPQTWPPSLRSSVSTILGSKIPMLLWWGKDHIQFYNDAYRPRWGDQNKHSRALGQKGADCLEEVWASLQPIIRQVLDTGESVCEENTLVPIYRNGSMEEAYWNVSYGPIRGDNGGIDGVLVICTEIPKKTTQEEDLFRTMAEGSHLLIALSDEKGLATYLNKTWTATTGWTLEDILTKGWLSLVHPDDIQKSADIFTEALKNQSGYTFEYRIRNTQGSYTWLLANGIPRFRPDKSFGGHISNCTNISAFKEAEERVRNSENQVREILESASNSMAVFTGPELRISLANRAALDIWKTGEDAIGKPLREVIPEMDDAIFKELQEVIATGIPLIRENNKIVLGTNGNSREYYFTYRAVPMRNTDGKVYGVMTSAADVTALNQAKKLIEENEKTIRNTILKAPIAICILRGPEFIIDVANDRMLELWGKTASDVMHKPVFIALPEVTNQGYEQMLKNVYTDAASISVQGSPITLNRDGRLSTEYINYLCQPEINAEGTVTSIIAVASIVTEQVLARQKIEQVVADRTKELAEANQRLEQSNANLLQFAHVASHDLQEPLRKISTYLDIIESKLGSTDPGITDYFEKTIFATKRMRQLIKDILTYSQLSPTVQLFEPIDLQAVIRSVLDDFDLQIEQEHAQITVGPLPTLLAIPLQMQQLFSNLISNALKYAKTNVPPHIQITAELNDHRYHIQVSDNGIGFAQNQAKIIFNIFQRLHQHNQYSGTGIGLAICQKIIENHHGEIYADSHPDEGAVFHIWLPASE
jgi:PAS domain S-box-containing protein